MTTYRFKIFTGIIDIIVGIFFIFIGAILYYSFLLADRVDSSNVEKDIEHSEFD